MEQQVYTARQNRIGQATVGLVGETVMNTSLNGPPGLVSGGSNISAAGHNVTTNGTASTIDMAVREATRTDKSQIATALNTVPFVSFEGYHGPLNPFVENVSPLYHFGKRLLDIVGASIGLLVLSPVFLCLYILVRLDSPGFAYHRRRVLARQMYNGEDMATFDAWKFRTMIVDADEYLRKNPDLMKEYQKEFKLVHDPRITRIGAPLRRSSLDELPQLWNVFTGQMSLVGPRMITPPELANYGPDAARLLAIKPGMTGLWQVSGRTNLPYSERVRLDMDYIENRSLKLDIEILIRTVGCVLGRRGAF